MLLVLKTYLTMQEFPIPLGVRKYKEEVRCCMNQGERLWNIEYMQLLLINTDFRGNGIQVDSLSSDHDSTEWAIVTSFMEAIEAISYGLWTLNVTEDLLLLYLLKCTSIY